MIDSQKIREDYPILNRTVNGKPLVYFDNAASSQAPRQVVETITNCYYNTRANVHRGVHTVSQEATDLMESTRSKVREFLNAESNAEIIFTRGTTEGINLVASCIGDTLCHGDEIIISPMEHHSNIVPWQLLQRNKRINIRVAPMNEKGEIIIEEFEDLFSENTRLVSLCHVSNVLGTVNPVKQLTEIAHKHGALVVIDGAQAAPHCKVDVRDIDCDFYALSSHKMFGPTGVGVLYGKRALLDKMPPYQGGGEMIGTVSYKKTTFAELPYKFEAGTPDYIGIAAFGTAIDYINSLGMENIAAHEQDLLAYATSQMLTIPEMRIFGNADHKSSVISFLVGNIHHYDMGMLLDKLGFAVRTGHHCAEPLMHSLGIEGTVRISFAPYNTRAEIDSFIAALKKVVAMLS